jgi:PAS domain S-box-containing protein
VASTAEFLQRVNTDPELSALRQLCVETLLACPEERVFFTDLHGRVILVSAGSLAAMASGGTPDDTVGKTAHEMFSEEIAKVADADERHILKTGETVVGKVRRMSIPGHSEMWMQTTKMALRDSTGAIVGTFGISRDLTAQIEAENALAHQALHDGLTGLPNRALILDRIDQMLARTRRSHGQCAAMFLDLDNFKDINDTLGHHAGDELLVACRRPSLECATSKRHRRTTGRRRIRRARRWRVDGRRARSGRRTDPRRPPARHSR